MRSKIQNKVEMYYKDSWNLRKKRFRFEEHNEKTINICSDESIMMGRTYG